jgi:hypothetical protein
MSEEGKLLGFQPTSRLAVSHWANNPLAALLYEGRKLSPGIRIVPRTSSHWSIFNCIYALYFVLSNTFKWTLSGFLEPRLKISRPAKVVPIELLMSVNSESFFALARHVQDPC